MTLAGLYIRRWRSLLLMMSFCSHGISKRQFSIQGLGRIVSPMGVYSNYWSWCNLNSSLHSRAVLMWPRCFVSCLLLGSSTLSVNANISWAESVRGCCLKWQQDSTGHSNDSQHLKIRSPPSPENFSVIVVFIWFLVMWIEGQRDWRHLYFTFIDGQYLFIFSTQC